MNMEFGNDTSSVVLFHHLCVIYSCPLCAVPEDRQCSLWDGSCEVEVQ